MSCVVEVSYQDETELQLILERLEDLNLTVSGKQYKTGRFRRCYLKSKNKLAVSTPAEVPEA